jgi:hypothetical protein
MLHAEATLPQKGIHASLVILSIRVLSVVSNLCCQNSNCPLRLSFESRPKPNINILSRPAPSQTLRLHQTSKTPKY